MSGANALWGREKMGEMGQNHLLGSGGNRLDTEVGYGVPLGARFVGTPRVGVPTSEFGQDYRRGYGLTPRAAFVGAWRRLLLGRTPGASSSWRTCCAVSATRYLRTP